MSIRSLLLPLTPLYRLGLAMRERRLASGKEPVRRLRMPVISIGNLSSGGAGKTPLAITLARALESRGLRVDVLSRGYGRSSEDSARVRIDGTADEFGDEPLLIAREAGVSVYVSTQRYEAGKLAESDAAAGTRAVHMLDDGFQHRQLYRDVDILLLSRDDLHDHLLPAGNLREPPEAMRRATVIAIPAEEIEAELELRRRGWQGPVWFLKRRMKIPALSGPVLAFCGIARPRQFFAGLDSAGVAVVARRSFRDHYRYINTDLDRLAAKARSSGASGLITTEKDQVRLAGLNSTLPIFTASLITEIEEESAALDWLVSRLMPGATAQRR